ncbi:MAG TPA: hypothetical protein VG937_29405 [Polyangiaceae bacterium]|nr:hypothetical protein [Polyangiaceae bacterium]
MRLGALTLTLCRVAEAQSPSAEAEPYRLSWVRERGAESCISGAALARLLEQVVGRGASPVGRATVVEGRIAPAEAPLRWRVNVRVSDAEGELLGERELTNAELPCSALTSPVLLILAMSIDPNAARDGLPAAVVEELRRDQAEDVDVWPANERREAPATLAERAAEAPTAPVEVAPLAREVTPIRADPESAERSRAAPSVEVLAGLSLSVALLPEPSPGVALGARVLLSPNWSLLLSGLAWLPREVAIEGPRAEADGVSFGATHLSSALCRNLLVASVLRVAACGGGLVGFRWVSASALGQEDNPTRAYYSPLLGVELELRAGERWFLHGGGTAMMSWPRDRFTYRDHAGEVRPLFEPRLVSGYSLVGFGARL